MDQSQRMLTQSQMQNSNLLATKSHDYSLEETHLKTLTDECVQYILFCYLAEHKSVLRRNDITKNILKDHARSFRTVLKMINKRLNDSFGLEIVEMDSSDKGEKFGIRSKFEYESKLNQSLSSIEKSKQSLSDSEISPEFQEKIKYSMLMISLSLIFMSENEIDANDFWDSLKRLDINKDEKRHKYLGDVFKFFTSELVKEGYLEYEMVRGIDPPQYKFKSGYRSKLEITKKSLLDFVCEVYGGKEVCKPEEWSLQYMEACKEDNDSNEANTLSPAAAAANNQTRRNNSSPENDEDDDNSSTQTRRKPATRTNLSSQIIQKSQNR